MPTTDPSALRRYRRAVDYLAAAQVYLKSNVLLEAPLAADDIKDRLLGHWGTAPGLNLIYTHLNRLILETGAGILLVTGPGHGAAANLANMYLEGTLTEYYPELTRDRAGLERFIKAFSWPGGFPSHLNPGLPGVINEGGELGYALGISFGAAFAWAYAEIRAIQSAWRTSPSDAVSETRDSGPGTRDSRPRWPVLLLRTPKGMGCPAEMDGEPMAGTFRAHQVPGKDLKTNPAHLAQVEAWFRSYRPEELWEDGVPAADIVACCPAGDLRMAENPHGFGGRLRRPLDLPAVDPYAVVVSPRGAPTDNMDALGRFLKDLILRDAADPQFRIVCPDELESNRLQAVLEATNRQYIWPVPYGSAHEALRGQVLEVLSEHDCQAWLQGYLLTGRHVLFPCYEAFVSIVDTMLNQYAKFIKASLEVPWRLPVSSLNYLLTSEAWRQDHNGYSHQGPGFINNLLTKKGQTYRIYLPCDSNTLLVTMDHCLRETNFVNLVVASKAPIPQWLSLPEAREHFRVGASLWPWAGTEGGEDPDLVFAGCGDHLTTEALAATQLLAAEVPAWRTRIVNVVNLLALGIPQKYPPGLEEKRFERLFPLGVPVIFNFHGYTAAIKQLLWERPGADRFDINGYREEGTTTTPFDMHVRNRTSRWHLILQAAEKMALRDPSRSAVCEALTRKYEGKLLAHHAYILEHGLDPPEITNWQWSPS